MDRSSISGRYQYKPWAYSSHTLLLKEFDPHGRNRWVLDVGCGQGYLARLLFELGYQVIGVDSSSIDLCIAKQWCYEVIQADLDNWLGPGNNQHFDYILMADILDHLRDPVSLLHRLKPFLNDQGKIVLSVPNVAHFYVRLMLLFGRWDYAERGIMDRTHLRFFTKASLIRCLKDVGITPYHVQPVILPWPFILDQIPELFVNIAKNLDQLAIRLWPTLFAYQWIVSGAYDETS